MIRKLLARLAGHRLPAPQAERDLWSGNYASFGDACAKAGAVPYAAIAQQPAYIKARLDPAGAASGAREAQMLDNKHRGLLEGLSLARIAISGPFHVVDFGGGLGLHHRALAARLGLGPGDRWTVVELPAVCAAGRAPPAVSGLGFVESLAQLPASPPPGAVLASGVLNAIEEPADLLRQFSAVAPWIVLGSLPLLAMADHRVAVNTTHQPPFPLWFFSEKKFLETAAALGLEVRLRWSIPETRWYLDGAESPPAAGLLFQRKSIQGSRMPSSNAFIRG